MQGPVGVDQVPMQLTGMSWGLTGQAAGFEQGTCLVVSAGHGVPPLDAGVVTWQS